MRDHADLYELRPGFDIRGAVMLVVLDGFVDAGSTGKQAVSALFDAYSAEVVATFDIDRCWTTDPGARR